MPSFCVLPTILSAKLHIFLRILKQNAIKYLFLSALSGVWLYYGCGVQRPVTDIAEREGATLIEQIAERIERREEVAVDIDREEVITVIEEEKTEETVAEIAEQAKIEEETVEIEQEQEVTRRAGVPAIMPDAMRILLPLLDSLEARGIAPARALELLSAVGEGGQLTGGAILTRDEAMLLMQGSELLTGEMIEMLADPEQLQMIMRMLEMRGAFGETGGEDFSALSDSIYAAMMDSIYAARPIVRPPPRPFLDHPIFATARDSMVFDLGNDMIYLFREATIDFQDMNLRADSISVNTITKRIGGGGLAEDSLRSRPEFTQGGQTMDMSIVWGSLDSREFIVENFAMQEGEGFMLADRVKIHANQTSDMQGGRYTTCPHTDAPHFYIQMYRGRIIPNEKVIFGLAHFYLEDVPIYFPFVPFGFFPLMTGPQSGFIVPSFGEEYEKGFFIRDGGYYLRLGDYADARLTGSLYSLGSWDANLASSYIKRYKYRGNLNFRYSQNIIGERGSTDYINSSSYAITWSHSQDPKARPNTNFSASVNFSTSGNKRFGSTTVEEFIQTQASSSISYSRTLPAAERFPGGNFTVAFRHSQNMRDSTVSFSFPQSTWSINRFKPLERRNRIGREKWYEKLTMSYSGSMQGSVDNVKEYEIFTQSTLDKMRTGIEHRIPVNLTMSVLNYINLTGSANYSERWLFRRQNLHWDQETKSVVADTTTGFYRVYDYNASASLTTKIFGMYEFRNPNFFIQRMRHVVTPSVSLSIKPDFGNPRFGFWHTYQSREDGTTVTYSPYTGLNSFGPPGRGESATMSLSLQQNLEAKVRTNKDTTGIRKIAIIENLMLSSSINLLRDSMKMDPIRFTLVVPIVKNLKLNLNGTLNQYQLDPETKRPINRLTFADGRLPRLTSANTGFSWNWAPTFGSTSTIEQFEREGGGGMNFGAGAGRGRMMPPPPPVQYGMDSEYDAEEMRRLLAAAYYDFSIPFNFGVSYTMSYANDRGQRDLRHSANFNASLTLTPYKAEGQSRWAISVSTFGWNFNERRLTPGNLSVVRDLHCFTMSLNWIPIGPRSWSFNIRIKSDILRDIKYDRNRSYFDSLRDF